MTDRVLLAKRFEEERARLRAIAWPGVAAVVAGRVVSNMAFEVASGRIVGLDVLADPVRLDELGVAGVLGV